MTGVIDRLERAGFVCRGHDTADRRNRLVVLPPAARARITPEYAQWIRLLDTALHRHNPTELAVMADFLADLSSGKGSHEQPLKPATT